VTSGIESAMLGAPALDRPRHAPGLSAALVAASRVAAVVAIAIGSLVLAGYLFRIGWAVQLRRSLPPMYPNTALGFVIGGLAAIAARRPGRRARMAGLVGFASVGVAATATLGLHIVDAGPTLLELLWPDDPVVASTTPVGGRPVAETCVAFMCISGAGVLLALRRSPALAQGLSLGTVSVGAAATLGFVIGVDRQSLGTSFVAVGMALHTALGLLSLGLAVMLAQPTVGVFGRLTHTGPTAQLSRRLVAVVVMAPILLASATAALARVLPDAALAQSVAAMTQVLALGLLVMLPLAAVEEVEMAAGNAMLEARNVREQAGEPHVILPLLTSQLLAPPAAPEGWDLGFVQTAAFGELPGDSCQLLSGADGRFLLALIDMAGHGTEPALQALRIRTEIAALWQAGVDLGAIADRVDASVREMDTIATGLLVEFDPATGLCAHVNAGHPALLAVGTGALERWERTRPLFGVPAVGPTRAEIRSVDRATFLVAYSDGVPESRAPDGRLLGDAAVEHAVRRHATTGVQAIADACLDAALAHAHARLTDDALCVVLQRR
jgi:hypothetical protein